MKKLLAVLLVWMMTVSCLPFALGEDAVSSATLTVSRLPEIQPRKGAHVLVVFFSTDDTIRAAAAIAADALEADLFEIVPETPYTREDLNYSSNSSRSTKEQRDSASRPAVAGLPENLAQYDVILLGYPIWWGLAPKILYTFVESVDLSGRTVIPFCTSASSGVGSSAKNLQKLTDETVTWRDAARLGNRSDADAIRAWAASLGIAP